MCGGGGSIQIPDPAEELRVQQQIDQAQRLQDQQDARRQSLLDILQHNQDIVSNDQALQAYIPQARQQFNDIISSRGLDPGQYQDLLNQEIQRIAGVQTGPLQGFNEADFLKQFGYGPGLEPLAPYQAHTQVVYPGQPGYIEPPKPAPSPIAYHSSDTNPATRARQEQTARALGQLAYNQQYPGGPQTINVPASTPNLPFTLDNPESFYLHSQFTGGQVPEGSTDFGQYFTPDVVDSILGTAKERDIRGYTNQFNQLFPTGFAANWAPQTADDTIINDILQQRIEPYSQQLETAKARGTLTDAGYNKAVSGLDEQRAQAASKLQGIGGGLISALRDRLSGIQQEGQTALGAYNLGQTFDPNAYYQQAQEARDTGLRDLSGNISAAAPAGSLFDIDSLLANAGRVQGQINPGSESLAAALAAREKERKRQRGLGSTGALA